MKKNVITLVITLAAAGSIAGVVGYNGMQMAMAKEASTQHVQQNNVVLPSVSVQTTTASAYEAEVIGYGETRPRFELQFASEVSGRVEWLADEFETGKVIEQGTVLARLDDTAYQQALSQAKADVADTRLELLEEERQGEQAKSEWQRSGLSGEPASPLVLREPQLASAKAKLVNAQQALEKAQKDLSDTEIKAPFDALVVTRDVQPGTYLASGGMIATFYSVDRIEVEIPLSEAQWANLPQSQDFTQWSVELTDSNGLQSWTGEVERAYQHLDSGTRQRSLIVTVDNPLEKEHPLFSGTFVQARLNGATMEQLWELPASAISQQGELWLVDDDGLLHKASADKAFERQDKVYVTPVVTDSEAQVVLRPLSTFNVGMKVSASENS
ncbi:efflux RND transporter periplasmic adaptor subunit [Vibrio superstes]|uniref:Membrane protein n=1 Tax=Vibrio superstes NBRC 103154 TaxID=1219062 RepID=A0A511QR48_9VIBR|nr:efflux RND transporter periplasmic adaptor subunit [Vibrio superstes]GEM79557.1 membrane protein [Vibrio superstes NBRC 103154]